VGGRAFEPGDILRVAWLSDPQASPDGGQVAFVSTRLDEERDEYRSSVWLVPTAGGEPIQLTAGPKRDRAPRWSPDGRWLAFLSERGDDRRPQIYLLPTAGGEPRRLTRQPNGVAEIAWSPDSRRLAFVARVGGEEPAGDRRDGEEPKPARVIDELKYKWNGDGFVHDRRPKVFVVDVDGGEPRPITSGDFADQHVAWSPAGDLIAFVSARHPERDRDNRGDLFVVSADGGEPRRLTATVGDVQRPAFSPDGRSIAYVGHEHALSVGRDHRLYVVPVVGGAPTCLTASLDRSCHGLPDGGPVWSADGQHVYVGVVDQGDVAVGRVPVGGGPFEMVVAGDRQVAALTLAGQRLVYAASDPVSPAELFVAEADGRAERALTDQNRAWKAEVERARPERFRYQRDGQSIDGWIVRPHGFAPERRYPTLLCIHGGPHAQYGHGFFDEFQAYAGAGYAVVFTNPRGSAGYGEQFARAVVGDWGGVDFADVLAGVDEALRRFDFVDPARLGVLGGSYGGYMTSWIVSHSDRFRAACSERALNDWWSFFGTADIGSWFPVAQSGGHLPWTNRDWYLERSPLTHAARINTPLLVMHAEDDLRCPISQGEAMFVALKMLGRETRFVRFPGENHDLSRTGKPRHRLERFRHILEWFDRYLKV
jgi:dipeptidyl aminopeptidase/acylaminoacyl peptidase